MPLLSFLAYAPVAFRLCMRPLPLLLLFTLPVARRRRFFFVSPLPPALPPALLPALPPSPSLALPSFADSSEGCRRRRVYEGGGAVASLPYLKE